MRTLSIMIAALSLIGVMHSCTYSCDCSKRCFLFDKDSVRICGPAYTGIDTGFNHMYDSLVSLYGPASGDTSFGFVKIPSGKLGQFESQGYSCDCSK